MVLLRSTLEDVHQARRYNKVRGVKQKTAILAPRLDKTAQSCYLQPSPRNWKMRRPWNRCAERVGPVMSLREAKEEKDILVLKSLCC